MPFTAAHPAAVLYLQRLPWNLSGIAMVAGSIAPDMEYYLRLRAHAVAVESLWLQLFIAVSLCLAWQWSLRWICTALLPNALVLRYGIASPVNVVQAAARNPGALLLSLLIGIFSHWAWDSFTHHDGSCIAWFPALADEWHVPFTDITVRVFFLLQVLSSMLGIAVVLLYRHEPTAERREMLPLLPTKKEKLRMRCIFLLAWAGVWLIGSFLLPAARFVWDDVFHVLGGGVYALLGIALVMFFARKIGQGKPARAGDT